MITDAFSVFRQFPILTVKLLRKEDDIRSDEQVRERIEAAEIASAAQVHGNETVVVREPTSRAIKADGLITDQRNLALTIRWADCQNFVVFAPEKAVFGLLHAGWRGLNSGAISNFFKTLEREFNIKPRETYIGAGPSLCKDCAEFSRPSQELSNIPPEFIHGRNVDMRGAADAELLSLGIPSSHIERHPDCTRCSSNLYWSYRGGDRDAVIAGKTNVLTANIMKN